MVHLAPRHTKEGSLDLTAATLFVTNTEMHGQVAQCVRILPRLLNFGQGKLNMACAVQRLLRTLHSLHTLWRQKAHLSVEDLDLYLNLMTLFGRLWHALRWKVSTWVHWVVRHLVAPASLHKSIYVFSSIPTERRNVEFKLDVTHCYKGWKLSRPHACRLGFAHVLNLSSLDIGLLLYHARRRGQKRVTDDV